MDRSSRIQRVTCPHCGHYAVWGPEIFRARLNDLGRLRREENPSWDLVSALIEVLAPQFPCGVCHRTGLQFEPWQDDFEDGPVGRPCEVCQQLIPAERLEIFLQTTRCVSCQSTNAQPVDASDFCPRCGNLLQTRARRGAGIARYESSCRACGYHG